MSIWTSSAELLSISLWKALIIDSSLGLSLHFFAEALRKEYQAAARHLSGIPFQVRSINLGFRVSNSNSIPSPSLPVFTTLAILLHFSARSHSFLLRLAAARPPSSS